MSACVSVCLSNCLPSSLLISVFALCWCLCLIHFLPSHCSVSLHVFPVVNSVSQSLSQFWFMSISNFSRLCVSGCLCFCLPACLHICVYEYLLYICLCVCLCQPAHRSVFLYLRLSVSFYLSMFLLSVRLFSNASVRLSLSMVVQLSSGDGIIMHRLHHQQPSVARSVGRSTCGQPPPSSPIPPATDRMVSSVVSRLVDAGEGSHWLPALIPHLTSD